MGGALSTGSHDYTHVHGQDLKDGNAHQTVIGRYNESGSASTPGLGNISDALFVIGGGTSDLARKNIVVVNLSDGIYIDAAALPTSAPAQSNRLWREADGSGGWNLKIS